MVLMRSDGHATASKKEISQSAPALSCAGRLRPGRAKRRLLHVLLLVPGASWVERCSSSTRFLVEGDSMRPALASRQHLLVDRGAYRFRPPARGDIVVLRDPEQPGIHCVKRIVGLAGEHVQMQMGSVAINGSPLGEPYAVGREMAETPFPRQWLLDRDEYLVLGDQRQGSRDSRAFGPVGRVDIIGKVWLRYWPPGVWSRL